MCSIVLYGVPAMSWLQFQDGLTYMDWTYPLTGLDLSVVWDPELWLQFKQAVIWNSPEMFWDKLWDRIAYSEYKKHGPAAAAATAKQHNGFPKTWRPPGAWHGMA